MSEPSVCYIRGCGFVTSSAGCTIFRERSDGRRLHEATFLSYCALSFRAKTVHSFTNTVPLCSNLIVKFKRWVNVAGTLSCFFCIKCSCCFVAEREVVFSLWSADPDRPVMVCASGTYLETFRKLAIGISCTNAEGPWAQTEWQY
jgi:hypothetical protein